MTLRPEGEDMSYFITRFLAPVLFGIYGAALASHKLTGSLWTVFK